MTFRDELKKHEPCEGALTWIGDRSLDEALRDCHRGDWMLWAFARLYPEHKRELFLAKGRCANTVRHLMRDKRSRDAVDAAIAYGEGLTGDSQLNAASASAYAAYAASAASAAAYTDAYSAAYAAAAYTDTAAYAACYASSAASYAAAYAADSSYYDSAASAAARIKNLKETADICREVFGPIVRAQQVR